MTNNDAKNLIRIAREAINSWLDQHQPAVSEPTAEALQADGACFVTIKLNGQLRGCIGNFVARQPLYREVIQMARAAASEDPRFRPLTAAEWQQCTLEITVLSPLQKISDTSRIEVGRHGIYLIQGPRRGVLLPQVASEQGWDRQTFLQQTCRKAGLPINAWQQPETDIYIFTGLILSEKAPQDQRRQIPQQRLHR